MLESCTTEQYNTQPGSNAREASFLWHSISTSQFLIRFHTTILPIVERHPQTVKVGRRISSHSTLTASCPLWGLVNPLNQHMLVEEGILHERLAVQRRDFATKAALRLSRLWTVQNVVKVSRPCGSPPALLPAQYVLLSFFRLPSFLYFLGWHDVLCLVSGSSSPGERILLRASLPPLSHFVSRN